MLAARCSTNLGLASTIRKIPGKQCQFGSLYGQPKSSTLNLPRTCILTQVMAAKHRSSQTFNQSLERHVGWEGGEEEVADQLHVHLLHGLDRVGRMVVTPIGASSMISGKTHWGITHQSMMTG